MGLTRKQKEVFDYICQYWKKNGLAPTQKEIKDHFQLKSFGSVQRYIKYLEEHGLLEGDWNARRGLIPHPDKLSNPVKTALAKKHEPTLASNVLELPLLGPIAAGLPLEVATQECEETIQVPANLVKKSGNHFVLKIKGDSMIEDGILSGDYVIIRAQNSASQGETVAVIMDGQATLKHFYKHKSHIELRPANSSMESIQVTNGEFQIAGVLVGLMRLY